MNLTSTFVLVIMFAAVRCSYIVQIKNCNTATYEILLYQNRYYNYISIYNKNEKYDFCLHRYDYKEHFTYTAKNITYVKDLIENVDFQTFVKLKIKNFCVQVKSNLQWWSKFYNVLTYIFVAFFVIVLPVGLLLYCLRKFKRQPAYNY
ncbi:hypothetical protein [Epiphyas postvittana nucleopolyhedrovirus]|uniref:Uncharacterized protein n=1 Tax=Epiphyas postvittana nucleopolyhedrovirus TaxID=70600 RepID=Q91GE2_NPVEP|nr:hypothetical protein [Epiphyas postvittana nucleopolyhedrovirus]AAK85677.1 unknown [Epiphyas postvittana nucleopolyhedrovirus]